jgi:hypothetical protein
MCFKNNEAGLKVLKWWTQACIDWCYARYEDGKMGDQLYLNDWLTRFEGVHELQHLGGGVAPWNVLDYEFYKSRGSVFLKDNKTNKEYPLVFFHFHALKFQAEYVQLTGSVYRIVDSLRQFVFFPYIKALESTKKKLNKIDPSFDPHGADLQKPGNLFFELKNRGWGEFKKDLKALFFGLKWEGDNENLLQYKGLVRYLWQNYLN